MIVLKVHLILLIMSLPSVLTFIERFPLNFVIPGDEEGTLFKAELVFTFPFALNLGRKKRDVEMDPENTTADDRLIGSIVFLDYLFNQLGVKNQECFELLLCSIHQNSKIYQPLPVIIDKLFYIDFFSIHHVWSNSSTAIRYHRYMKAFQKGQSYSPPCAKVFPECLQKIDEILYGPIFQLLNLMNTFFPITYKF